MCRDEFISEIQTQLATIQHQLKLEQTKNNEEQIFYQERIQELRNELEHQSVKYSNQVQSIEADNESLKKKIEELKHEMEHQSMRYSSQIQSVETENSSLKKRMEELKREHQSNTTERDTSFKRQQNEIIQAYEARIESLSVELRNSLTGNKKNKELAKLYQLECEEQLRQKEQEIESIRRQVEEKWNIKAKEFEELRDNEWNLKLELKSEKEKNASLRNQLEERKSDVQDYKEQMKDLIEKENLLKKELFSLQLQSEKELEQRIEDLNAKNEGIIKALKKSLDDAQSELQDKQKYILELKAEIKQKTVQAQRNAIATELRGSVQREKMEKDIDMEFGLETMRSLSPVESLNMDFDFDSTAPTKGSHSKLAMKQQLQNSQIMTSQSIKEFNSLKDERDELKNQVEKLEEQKAQIKEVIAHMKSDLEDYQNVKDALAEAELELQHNYTRIKQLESQVQVLQSTNVDSNLIKQLYEQISILTEKVERKDESGGVAAAEQVTRLNTLMTDLRMDLEEQRDQLLQSQAKMEDLTKENVALKLKLKEAAKELKNVIKERERLIDISNMLKAQLNRMREQLHESSSRRTPPSERQDDLIQKYHEKIQKLEARMTELNTNNDALREELTKVKIKNKQLQIQRAMENDDQTTRNISSLRDSIQKITMDKNHGNGGNNLRLSSDVIVGEVDDDDVITELNHRKASEHSSWSKQKLDEVRSSLSLSGRIAPLATRYNLANDAESSATTTTKSKSLKALQKKRAEIVPKRKAVRDVYN